MSASPDIFQPHRKKKLGEPNLVPFLDVFMVVVFFLILGASFENYNKLLLPPSQSVTVNTVANPPPLNPKLFVLKKTSETILMLMWAGTDPGLKIESLPTDSRSKELMVQKMNNLTSDFKSKHISEDTIQLGLARDQNYQMLVDVMDAVSMQFKNVALISYLEAEAQSSLIPKENGEAVK